MLISLKVVNVSFSDTIPSVCCYQAIQSRTEKEGYEINKVVIDTFSMTETPPIYTLSITSIRSMQGIYRGGCLGRCGEGDAKTEAPTKVTPGVLHRNNN